MHSQNAEVLDRGAPERDPAKFHLTAAVVDVGTSAVQKQQEHCFRDLDRTNAPLPETDLFAGL